MGTLLGYSLSGHERVRHDLVTKTTSGGARTPNNLVLLAIEGIHSSLSISLLADSIYKCALFLPIPSILKW